MLEVGPAQLAVEHGQYRALAGKLGDVENRATGSRAVGHRTQDRVKHGGVSTGAVGPLDPEILLPFPHTGKSRLHI